MLLTIVELVLPALILFTTLFGVLARGNPKPGGVALFARVGLVGLALGGAAFYVIEKTDLLPPPPPELAVNAYRGVVAGSVLLLLFAAFGVVLKRKQ